MKNDDLEAARHMSTNTCTRHVQCATAIECASHERASAVTRSALAPVDIRVAVLATGMHCGAHPLSSLTKRASLCAGEKLSPAHSGGGFAHTMYATELELQRQAPPAAMLV